MASSLCECDRLSLQLGLLKGSALGKLETDCAQELGLDPEAVLDKKVCFPLFCLNPDDFRFLVG